MASCGRSRACLLQPPALPPAQHHPLQLQPALESQWLGQVQGGLLTSPHPQGLSSERHLQQKMQFAVTNELLSPAPGALLVPGRAIAVLTRHSGCQEGCASTVKNSFSCYAPDHKSP